MEGRTYLATVREHFTITKDEWKGIVIGTIIIAFIFSFRSWGTDVFSFAAGFFNFFNAILIAFLALLVHVSLTKVYSISKAHTAEYKMWFYGLLLGLVLCVVSRGRLWFFAPGGLIIHHMKGHRLGYFRYWTMNREKAFLSFMGPLGNLLLAFFFKLISYLPFQFALVDQAILLNTWLALFTMLPIRPLAGCNLLFYSRLWYMLCLGIVLGCALSLTYLGLLSAILIAVLLGVLFWGVFLFYWEG